MSKPQNFPRLAAQVSLALVDIRHGLELTADEVAAIAVVRQLCDQIERGDR